MSVGLEILHLVHLISNLLVRMSLDQSVDGPFSSVSPKTHDLGLDLLDALQCPRFPDCRVRSFGWEKHARSDGLKTAFGILAQCAGAGGEDGFLALFEIGRGNVEDEFVAILGHRCCCC